MYLTTGFSWSRGPWASLRDAFFFSAFFFPGTAVVTVKVPAEHLLHALDLGLPVFRPWNISSHLVCAWFAVAVVWLPRASVQVKVKVAKNKLAPPFGKAEVRVPTWLTHAFRDGSCACLLGWWSMRESLNWASLAWSTSSIVKVVVRFGMTGGSDQYGTTAWESKATPSYPRRIVGLLASGVCNSSILCCRVVLLRKAAWRKQDHSRGRAGSKQRTGVRRSEFLPSPHVLDQKDVGEPSSALACSSRRERKYGSAQGSARCRMANERGVLPPNPRLSALDCLVFACLANPCLCRGDWCDWFSKGGLDVRQGFRPPWRAAGPRVRRRPVV